MPEEINRIVTDRLSDLLLTHDLLADEYLRKEGVDEREIKFVGNIKIDTLDANYEKASLLDNNEILIKNLISYQPSHCFNLNSRLSKDGFAVLPLHRPSNVNDPNILSKLVDSVFNKCHEGLTVVWQIHPRTL